jgi:hypothetical protein
MLIPVRDLVRRWRGPRSRSEEVAALRSRLAAASREKFSDEEVAAARELRELRAQAASVFRGVHSCTRCAQGRPPPHGHFIGGFCCGGKTADVFHDDEVAALAAGGTRGRYLRVPDGDHAGCAFRGPEGCSLDARDRPTLCVRFVCRELEAELRSRGEWTRVRAATRMLEEALRRFARAREARGARVPSPRP